MKTFFKSVLLAAALIMGIAACGGASAATPSSQTYVDDNLNIFSINQFLYVGPAASGWLEVKHVNGNQTFYRDASGALLNKILVNNPQFVQLGGKWLNPSVSIRITCAAGVLSFGMMGAGNFDFTDPNCTTFNQIRVNSQ